MLPLQWRLQVLQAQVQGTTGVSVKVEEADLLALTGADREAAMEGLTAGREFPFVIVGGILACSGDLELERIVEVVTSASSTQR